MAPLALVANLATRWRHLHCFQSWPPDCVTCIATLPWMDLLAYQLVLSWYPHQPESHKSHSLHKVLEGVTGGHPDPKIGPQVYLGPMKITILGHISPTKHPWKMESCVFTFVVVSLNPANTTQPSTQHTSSIDPQVRHQSTFSPACLLTKVPGAPSANVTSVDVPENEYTQLHNKCNYTNDLFEKKTSCSARLLQGKTLLSTQHTVCEASIDHLGVNLGNRFEK